MENLSKLKRIKESLVKVLDNINSKKGTNKKPRNTQGTKKLLTLSQKLSELLSNPKYNMLLSPNPLERRLLDAIDGSPKNGIFNQLANTIDNWNTLPVDTILEMFNIVLEIVKLSVKQYEYSGKLAKQVIKLDGYILDKLADSLLEDNHATDTWRTMVQIVRNNFSNDLISIALIGNSSNAFFDALLDTADDEGITNLKVSIKVIKGLSRMWMGLGRVVKGKLESLSKIAKEFADELKGILTKQYKKPKAAEKDMYVKNSSTETVDESVVVSKKPRKQTQQQSRKHTSKAVQSSKKILDTYVTTSSKTFDVAKRDSRSVEFDDILTDTSDLSDSSTDDTPCVREYNGASNKLKDWVNC